MKCYIFTMSHSKWNDLNRAQTNVMKYETETLKKKRFCLFVTPQNRWMCMTALRWCPISTKFCLASSVLINGSTTMIDSWHQLGRQSTRISNQARYFFYLICQTMFTKTMFHVSRCHRRM